MRVLGDFFTLQRGNTYKSSLLGMPGPVLLGLGSIARNGGFKGDNLKTYGGPSDPRILLGPGDIYVSLKDVTQSADLLGAVARVPPEVTQGRLTQDTVKLVFRSQDGPNEYLYWLLQTPDYRAYCKAHSTGTTNLGLPREDFLAFPVPELTAGRRWVVDSVQMVESKIELNRRMNETLEAMAQAIFRDWFVDFGPVRRKMDGATDPVAIMGGLTPDPARAAELAALFPADLDSGGLPKAWFAGQFGDLAVSAGNGVQPATLDPETPYIGLEHMPRRSIALQEWDGAGKVASQKARFERGQVLFGKLRPYFHKVGLAPTNGVCSTDIVVLDAKLPFDRPAVLCCAASDDFVAFNDQASTGTKMPRTSWAVMRSYPLAVPPEATRQAFGQLVGPMLERILAGVAENRTLAEARDYLLPRLMSGEVRVSGDAISTEAA